MKIVITSPSFSKNPVLRQEITKLGFPVQFNESGFRPAGEALAEYINDAEIAIISLEQINDRILKKCPNLKLIAKFGVGIDNVDLTACKQHGVKVIWKPGVNKLSVAELTLCFMLGLMRNIFFSSFALKNQHWSKQGGHQLTNKTIGIVGVNHIGKEIIRLLKPFDCKILLNDIADITEFAEKESLDVVNFDTLIRSSDVISLHIPSTDLTKGVINKQIFNKMKNSAFLINTARGNLIVGDDLKEALSNQQIAGAALDVFEQEPPFDTELLQLPNLMCTPHIGGTAYEAVIAMGMSAIDQIKEHLAP